MALRMLEEGVHVLELPSELAPGHKNAFLSDEKWRAAKSVTPLTFKDGTCAFVNEFVRNHMISVCLCTSLRDIFSLVSSDLSSVREHLVAGILPTAHPPLFMRFLT